MNLKPTALLLAGLLFASGSYAQQHSEQNHSKYVAPTDPLVQQKLSKWQDIKFGMLMHWGTYSQWGIVESWSLCPEDEGWCERRGPHSHDWYEYKRLTRTFPKPLILSNSIRSVGQRPRKVRG